MNLKFDELVEQIMQEGIGDPSTEADAVRVGNAYRDQRLADLGARGSSGSAPRRRYDDETPGKPHYQVNLSPEGKVKYKRSLEFMAAQKPELVSIKQKMEACNYSYKTFLANKPGAMAKAQEFANKYGVKDDSGAAKEPHYVYG